MSHVTRVTSLPEHLKRQVNFLVNLVISPRRPEPAEFVSWSVCCRVSPQLLTLPSSNKLLSVPHLSTLGSTKPLQSVRSLCSSFLAVLSFIFLSALAGGGNAGRMNEFLLGVGVSHPSLVSSHKLPPLSDSLSQSPSLSVRIPPYLSEQGGLDSCEGEERREESYGARKKREESESKQLIEEEQKGWRSTNKEDSERLYHGLWPSHLLFSPVPRWVVFLRPVGYFGPSVSEQLGMDAIMLQEKLVERLLCPRVRTARQKVKKIYKYFWVIDGLKKTRKICTVKEKKRHRIQDCTKNEGTRIHLWAFFWRWLEISSYSPHHFFVQSFFHSLLWLFLWAYHPGTVCTACGYFIYLFFLAVSVFFFFLSAILTRGGCRKRPWQVVTAFTDACCVLLLWGCGVKKELFVCERTLLTDLGCAFLCTHGNAYCGDGVTCFFFFCQMQRRKAAGLRATCATHTLSDWCLVVLFVSVRTLVGKSEALLIHSCSHRERCCARVFPRTCRFSVL